MPKQKSKLINNFKLGNCWIGAFIRVLEAVLEWYRLVSLILMEGKW